MTTKDLIIYQDSNFVVWRGADQEDGPRLHINVHRIEQKEFTPQEATQTLAKMSIAIMAFFRESGEHVD